MSNIYVRGMHGMGDNIHQRALMKQLSEKYANIYLETSWPQIYHDMPKVKCLNKGTKLRTQLKNQSINKDKFSNSVDKISNILEIKYPPQLVRESNGVLDAMIIQCRLDRTKNDFSMTLPLEWIQQAEDIIKGIDKPIIIYRPLVERKEWGGCFTRNPKKEHYENIFKNIRQDYFVISIADIDGLNEWIVGGDVDADMKFHKGELTFEQIAGLIFLSEFVYSAPGFAIPLALSVGTKAIAIFGGYENSKSFFGENYLGIDTKEPCQCFSHTHNCVKDIDEENALKRIKEFLDA